MKNTINEVKALLQEKHEEVINGVVEGVKIHAGLTGKSPLEVIKEEKENLVKKAISGALGATVGAMQMATVIDLLTKGKANAEKNALKATGVGVAVGLASYGIVKYYGKKAQEILEEEQKQQA